LVITIIGTRPQYIKASVLSNALKLINIPEIVIDTNQHYSNTLSKNVIESLPYQLKTIKVSVGNSFEDLLLATEKKVKKYLSNCKAIVVFGDTNSTLVGSVIAKKHYKKLIHIESGERSWNDNMPEEKNRVLADYLCDLCLCVNQKSIGNLKHKSAIAKKVVGDLVYDSFLAVEKKLSKTSQEEFAYFTLHRSENTNSVNKINNLLAVLGQLKMSILWPMHPRVKKIAKQLEVPANIKIINPVSYLESLQLIQQSQFTVTDSGGIQKEAYWLQKKCITLRNETEWTETLIGNWNILVKNCTIENLNKAILKKTNAKLWSCKPFGKGKAAHKIAKEISAFIK
jgi:UDP-GlcNAc3NAcA epimerase